MSAGELDDRFVVHVTLGELRLLIRDEVERGLHTSKPTTARWCDVGAAAKHFGCTRQTIHNWIKLGAPARQIGDSAHPQYRLELAEFEAWVRSQGK